MSVAFRCLVATGLLVVLTGCADSESKASGADDSTPPSTVDIPADKFVEQLDTPMVEVKSVDNSFEERYLTVSAGTRVTFRNTGRNDHSVVPVVKGSFQGVDTAKFVPGSSHIVSFDKPGDYAYYCSLHGTPKNGQNGVIRVVAKS